MAGTASMLPAAVAGVAAAAVALALAAAGLPGPRAPYDATNATQGTALLHRAALVLLACCAGAAGAALALCTDLMERVARAAPLAGPPLPRGSEVRRRAAGDGAPGAALRRSLLARAARLGQVKSGAQTRRPPPLVPHRSQAVQEGLQEVIRLLLRDYLDSWYAALSASDLLLGEEVRGALWTVLDALQARLVAADLAKLLTRDLVTALCAHFQGVRQFPASQFPSHPCLISADTERRYLQRAAEATLDLLLPVEACPSTAVRCVLQEVLATSVLQRSVEAWCDPDRINAHLLAQCERSAQEAQRSKAAYAYADTYAGFVRVISDCEDLGTLSQIRYHIIAEIMQANLIRGLKAEARGESTRSSSAWASLSDTSKGAHLQGRNLGRYINQCLNCKALCEKRLVMLGGPDYRESGAAGTGAWEATPQTGRHPSVLTLPQVIADGLALGYFMQFLQMRGRAAPNLHFWLACESLKTEVMGGKTITKSRILNIREICKAPKRSESSRIQVTAMTMDRMEQAARRLDAEPPDVGARTLPNSADVIRPTAQDLNSFYTAQAEVYSHLEERFYRPFLMHQLYADYVRHSGQASDRERGRDKDLRPGEALDESMDEGNGPDGAALPTSPLTPTRAGAEPRPRALSVLQESEEAEVPDTPVYQDGDIERRLAELQLEIESRQRELAEREFDGEDTGELVRGLQGLSDQHNQLKHHMERTQEWIVNVGRWAVQVQASEVVADGTGSEHTLYALTVHTTSRSDSGTQSGWVVTRQLDEFIELHEELRDCKKLLPKSLPVPKKRWFRGANQAEKTRAALELYLQTLLGDEILCQSESVYAFLCPSPEHLRRTNASPRKPARKSRRGTTPADEGGASKAGEGDAGEAEESMDSVAEPLYLLISDIFELKGMFSWFRRQLVAFVQLTYGTTINKNVRETMEWLQSEAQILAYIALFKATMFPEDWVPPEERSLEEKVALQQEARDKLLESLPAVLQSLVGHANCRRGALRVFNSLQNKHINKHLFYTVFETVLVALGRPELQERDLHKVAVPLDATGDWLGDGPQPAQAS